MKKLNLASYGVEEMNLQEMENVDGGSIWSWIGAAVYAVCLLSCIPPVQALGLVAFATIGIFDI